MWSGRIKDINIWKEDRRINRQLTRNLKKEILSSDGLIAFYMGPQLMNTDIEMLNLSVRSYNSLKRAGINTISELENMLKIGKNLRDIRNLGASSEMEIINAINGIWCKR